jgi:hypothetical protein
VHIRIFLALLVISPIVMAQEKCAANMSLVCIDIPLFLGYRVESDCSYTPPADSQPCSPCVYNWSVDVEFTQPVPLGPGGIQLCITAPTPICKDALVTEVGVNPPPYVYTFESITDNFQIGCGSNLQTILSWNPGLGAITIADLVLTCGSCN